VTDLFATLTPDRLLRSTFALLGFTGALFVLSIIIPGKRQLGVRNPDGSQVHYTLNGFRIFLTVVALCASGAALGWLDLTFPYRHFFPLLIVANAFAFTWTFVLYVWGRSKGCGGKDGLSGGFVQIVKDLFYGTDLNPRLLGVDLKLFSYRPSLIGLGVLNTSFAFAQFREHGHLSAPMVLYQIFYFLYLANYFQFEYGMIYTWDIIAERFGWMLVWGDYVLVPFFYSVPGWYLVGRLEPLPIWQIALLCALYTTGFCLFRGSNEQKHQYKTNPSCRIWGKPAEALGGKLLVSGFWGIGRKLNYSGEIMMYYAWALTTGTQSIVPYLLPLWLSMLLPHRAYRDEERCRAKYGELWEAYCRRARFRMVPFIY
jgi:delta14-sterol reductase